MILAIDTSCDVGSITVIASEQKKIEIKISSKQLHAEKLIFLIKHAIDSLNVSLGDIKTIGISIGPGSFTGLRVSLSVAKGLCYALEKPLIAVPTLDALALKAKQICDALRKFTREDIFICPVLNAKQADFYYSFYKYSEDKITRITDYLVGELDDIKRRKEGFTVFLGDGVDLLKERFSNQLEWGLLLKGDFTYPDALCVAQIAEQKYNNGEFADIESIEPIYVKEFIVKTK